LLGGPQGALHWQLPGYVHATRNPWDLKGCWQKPGESLRDYIRWFSQKYHEVLKICDVVVILAFWSGTSCGTLVHGFILNQPVIMKELLNIASYYTSGEEAVRAIFI
jgi:hypothetical protein